MGFDGCRGLIVAQPFAIMARTLERFEKRLRRRNFKELRVVNRVTYYNLCVCAGLGSRLYRNRPKQNIAQVTRVQRNCFEIVSTQSASWTAFTSHRFSIRNVRDADVGLATFGTIPRRSIEQSFSGTHNAARRRATAASGLSPLDFSDP